MTCMPQERLGSWLPFVMQEEPTGGTFCTTLRQLGASQPSLQLEQHSGMELPANPAQGALCPILW
jgi:hypothetical protein